MLVLHFNGSLIKGYLLLGLTFMLVACGHRYKLPDALAHLEESLPEEVSYNFQIKPILSDRCFNCHGPDADKREGDLRLDIDDWTTSAEVDKKQQEVYDRILSDDQSVMMPPPESKLSLTDGERALLIKWIDQGTEYEEHWSFSAVKHTDVPEDVHPVDYFIDERLLDLGLAAEESAAPEHLIRRLAFDLTGLPPSLHDIDDFVQKPSAETYQTFVEKYLGGPAYGERMAADWMDVARYADSDGYLDDKHRDFTPWRDWVIKSFNQNMPYDQFVTWQLAGDLINEPNPESILATAFNRLHRKIRRQELYLKNTGWNM